MHCCVHFLFHLFRYARHYCASNVSLSIFSLYCMQNKTFLLWRETRNRASERGERERVKCGLNGRKLRTRNFPCYDSIENDSFHRFRHFSFHHRCTLTACVKKMCRKSNWKLCIDGKSWKNINLNEECTLHAVCKLHSFGNTFSLVRCKYIFTHTMCTHTFAIRHSHSISTAHSLFGRRGVRVNPRHTTMVYMYTNAKER